MVGCVLVLPDTSTARRQVERHDVVLQRVLPARGADARVAADTRRRPRRGILFVPLPTRTQPAAARQRVRPVVRGVRKPPDIARGGRMGAGHVPWEPDQVQMPPAAILEPVSRSDGCCRVHCIGGSGIWGMAARRPAPTRLLRRLPRRPRWPRRAVPCPSASTAPCGPAPRGSRARAGSPPPSGSCPGCRRCRRRVRRA